ncbi:hypothetical protein HB770_04095 [Rhizobium leguminosarum bv. viciae]|uniref:Tail terminator n=1 Tax=Rhizobium leguminosarum bv. viciae TaxID=387 RepID=A0A7G6RHU5_RHILV|nr:hypothetical protein HB770_04095 [Rhizobium leguminosarum bv. viciae]
MTEHVKTQLRKGIEQRLRAAVPSLASVVPAVRAERSFQSNEIPLATVQVADAGVPVGGNIPSSQAVRRNMSVVIQLGCQSDIDDVADVVEALQVEVEAALTDSTKFGVPGIKNWSYGGSTPPDTGYEAGLAVLTLNYTCWLTTAPGQANKII